uniref:Probable peptidoglycan glycosyltransferase FtsW n=1 Tax=candidate division WOR-3 bacterium TaxID=2052148 RepID=A0A7C4TC98_UNCW3
MQLNIDKTLTFTILALLILGMVFVYSSSYYKAMRQGEATTYYLLGHIKRIIIGIGFFFLGFFLPYEKTRKILLPTYFILFILLVLTILFGKFVYGAKRTIPFGSFGNYGVQVSEFVRVWIVLFMANFFASHPQVAYSSKRILIAIFFPLSLIILVALQPSISLAIISFFSLFVMLIYGNIKFKFLAPVILCGMVIFLLAFLVLPHVRERMVSFFTQPGYQVQQSLIAIGSGGLFGRGPGAGLQKFLFLPKIYNDFIFAHIAEEIGFIGSALLFIFYWELFFRGITIANLIEDEYPKLIVQGFNATIFIIFLIHVGVSLGLLPATGIPLPFISYGGWSLSANLFSAGMILQISKLR